MKNLLKIAFAMMMFLGVANAASKTYEGKKMVVTLASGDLMASGLGTALALGAAKNGAEVTVVISANSLKYVTKGGWAQKFPAKKKSIRQILEKMVDNGANILVCSMCAKFNGVTQDKLIKGALIAKLTPILDAMLDFDAKTFEY